MKTRAPFTEVCIQNLGKTTVTTIRVTCDSWTTLHMIGINGQFPLGSNCMMDGCSLLHCSCTRTFNISFMHIHFMWTEATLPVLKRTLKYTSTEIPKLWDLFLHFVSDIYVFPSSFLLSSFCLFFCRSWIIHHRRKHMDFHFLF